MTVINADKDSDLVELLEDSSNAVVLFAGSWCFPRALESRLPLLAMEFAMAKFIYVDLQKNPQSAARLGVTEFPTFMIFKQGNVIAQIHKPTWPNLESSL